MSNSETAYEPVSRRELTAVVATIVRRCAGRNAAATHISHDTSLWDAGIGSLAVVRIVVSIEDEFGVEFSPDLITRDTFRSVNSIATVVARLLWGQEHDDATSGVRRGITD